MINKSSMRVNQNQQSLIWSSLIFLKENFMITKSQDTLSYQMENKNISKNNIALKSSVKMLFL